MKKLTCSIINEYPHNQVISYLLFEIGGVTTYLE